MSLLLDRYSFLVWLQRLPLSLPSHLVGWTYIAHPRISLRLIEGETWSSRLNQSRHSLVSVCGKHLTTISNVFEALLGPHFREGHSQHTILNTLLLPEDDPESMELLCKLAHLPLTNVSDVKPNQLEGLVIVCDKSGCAKKLHMFFQAVLAKWLANHTRSAIEHDGLRVLDALSLAFLVKDAGAFNVWHELLQRCTSHSRWSTATNRMRRPAKRPASESLCVSPPLAGLLCYHHPRPW